MTDRIRVGVFLASYFPPERNVRDGIASMVDRAQQAEDEGYDSIFLGHHILAASQFLQPVPVAAHLAALTSRVRIGFGVYLLPLVNPLVVAEELATIHHLSDGRFIAGFGAGYREKEFDAVGVPFDQRFKRMEEYIDVVRRLWAGETVTHDGSFGSLRNARVNLTTAGGDAPPIWVGAFGDIGIKRSARLGASWMSGPEGTLDLLAARLDSWRGWLDHYGHTAPRDVPMVREVFVADTDEEAIRVARPHLEAQYSDYKSWDHGLSGDDMVTGHAVVGSPESVATRLNAYRSIGFTEVVVRTEWPGMDSARVERSFELLAREVMPRLQGPV